VIGLDLGSFEVLTFDCCGTLIDWEAGILAAVRLADLVSLAALTAAGDLLNRPPPSG
jgi:hypothetical protein